MSQGLLKPARCAELARAPTSSSQINVIHEPDDKSLNKARQQFLAKNHCYHNPIAPNLFEIPAHHKKRALVIQKVGQYLNDAYFNPKKKLRSLQFHFEKSRQVRSQRREACISLLKVMNYYQDDSTGRIGRFIDGGAFRDLSLAKLAKHAGIAFKRALRAFRDLIKAEYISVSRQFIRNDETGECKGLPSIRSFLPKFYQELDIKGEIWTRVFSQKEWARKREEKRYSKQEKKKAHAMFGMIRQGLEVATNVSNKVVIKARETVKSVKTILGIDKNAKRQLTDVEVQANMAHQKHLMNTAMEAFKRDSTYGILELYKALIEKYPPPH